VTSPDVLERDVTTASTIPASAVASGVVVAREPLVVCGLSVAARVWEVLAERAGMPDSVELFPLLAEGAEVEAGTAIAEIEGAASVVFAAERTALNFLMVLSGIATEARLWQQAAGVRTAVVDTRKTYPGLRALSKYAVSVGGATNHREGLFDMVLLKDNHLAEETIAEAIELARAAHPDLRIEVEAETVAQAVAASAAGADIVLLDNMDDETLAEATEAIRLSAAETGTTSLIEASGGITYDRLEAVAAIGVDRVSTSALTFARPVDLALDAQWSV
jgi:nicotinate-nucleotide pyrophosphorylase (carboxylating)